MTGVQLSASVKERARELGFNSCGVTDLSSPPHGDKLVEWLKRGMAGTMTYMNRQAKKRLRPESIVDGTTRAIMVTRSYYTKDPTDWQDCGRVAKYARGCDYHQAMSGPLEELAQHVVDLSGPTTITRTFVDAGPVPERELAQRAGLGWIGKNTMLIDPGAGSFFFIGSILTDAPLDVDVPFEHDRCGTCTRCIDACPTGAILGGRVLNSLKCISYLTIEHRGAIDEAIVSQMGSWVFGCDICQDVCPWNLRFAVPATDAILKQDPELACVNLERMCKITDEEFELEFGPTPMERPGAEGLRRNATIALNNARGEPALGNQRPVG